jgi:hypothetical protein
LDRRKEQHELGGHGFVSLIDPPRRSRDRHHYEGGREVAGVELQQQQVCGDRPQTESGSQGEAAGPFDGALTMRGELVSDRKQQCGAGQRHESAGDVVDTAEQEVV